MTDDYQKLFEMVKENNRILRKMQSRARWSNFASILKWVIIIAVLIGAFVFAKPFFIEIKDLYLDLTSGNFGQNIGQNAVEGATGGVQSLWSNFFE
jgi:polyferredoxin